MKKIIISLLLATQLFATYTETIAEFNRRKGVGVMNAILDEGKKVEEEKKKKEENLTKKIKVKFIDGDTTETTTTKYKQSKSSLAISLKSIDTDNGTPYDAEKVSEKTIRTRENDFDVPETTKYSLNKSKRQKDDKITNYTKKAVKNIENNYNVIKQEPEVYDNGEIAKDKYGRTKVTTYLQDKNTDEILSLEDAYKKEKVGIVNYDAVGNSHDLTKMINGNDYDESAAADHRSMTIKASYVAANNKQKEWDNAKTVNHQIEDIWSRYNNGIAYLAKKNPSEIYKINIEANSAKKYLKYQIQHTYIATIADAIKEYEAIRTQEEKDKFIVDSAFRDFLPDEVVPAEDKDKFVSRYAVKSTYTDKKGKEHTSYKVKNNVDGKELSIYEQVDIKNTVERIVNVKNKKGEYVKKYFMPVDTSIKRYVTNRMFDSSNGSADDTESNKNVYNYFADNVSRFSFSDPISDTVSNIIADGDTTDKGVRNLAYMIDKNIDSKFQEVKIKGNIDISLSQSTYELGLSLAANLDNDEPFTLIGESFNVEPKKEGGKLSKKNHESWDEFYNALDRNVEGLTGTKLKNKMGYLKKIDSINAVKDIVRGFVSNPYKPHATAVNKMEQGLNEFGNWINKKANVIKYKVGYSDKDPEELNKKLDEQIASLDGTQIDTRALANISKHHISKSKTTARDAIAYIGRTLGLAAANAMRYLTGIDVLSKEDREEMLAHKQAYDAI